MTNDGLVKIKYGGGGNVTVLFWLIIWVIHPNWARIRAEVQSWETEYRHFFYVSMEKCLIEHKGIQNLKIKYWLVLVGCQKIEVVIIIIIIIEIYF